MYKKGFWVWKPSPLFWQKEFVNTKRTSVPRSEVWGHNWAKRKQSEGDWIGGIVVGNPQWKFLTRMTSHSWLRLTRRTEHFNSCGLPTSHSHNPQPWILDKHGSPIKIPWSPNLLTRISQFDSGSIATVSWHPDSLLETTNNVEPLSFWRRHGSSKTSWQQR